MKNAYQQHQATQISNILAALPKQAGAGVEDFTRQFYARVPVEDLKNIKPAVAVAIALSAHGFMEKRTGPCPQDPHFHAR